MGSDELASDYVWQDHWLWLKLNNKKGGKYYKYLLPFFAEIIFSKRFQARFLFIKLLGDNFCIYADGVKARHFIILNKIYATTTAMTD